MFCSALDDSVAKQVGTAVMDVMEGSRPVDECAAEQTIIMVTDPAAPDLLTPTTHLRQVGYIYTDARTGDMIN